MRCRHFRVVFLSTIQWLVFSTAVGAQTTSNNLTNSTLLAKAGVDECWAGLGINTAYDFPPCAAPEKPKVNQGYIWSMVDTGDEIWFGTTANAMCTTQGAVSPGELGITPYKTEAYACEYSASPYTPPLPAPLGDLRPPQMFVYNKATKVLTNITPKGRVSAANPLGLDGLVRLTVGLRAAVRAGNHVIFAGPSIWGGISMFAFRIDNKALVAKTSKIEYINIRDFVTYNGVIYTGVRKTLGGGSVLRYRGSIPDIAPPPPLQELPNCLTCFLFETVGAIDNEAANLAVHEGRLYTSTWPDSAMAGLWMSPVIPDTGLTRSHAAGWLKVWEADDYEPDPVIAASYSGGALASYGGYLYWGTIHVPYVSLFNYIAAYGEPANQEELAELIQKTFRTLALFRGKDFDSATQVELLYGAQKLYKYTDGNPGAWALADNNMGGVKPLYGTSGFNRPFNLYTWQMAVWNDKLWVSTFDWSYIAYLSQSIETIPAASKQLTLKPPRMGALDLSPYGADLYFFSDTTNPAKAETVTGLGNYASYGVRRLAPTSTSMFAGMANPMNLLTDTTDTLPEGGWELIEMVLKTAIVKN